MLRRPIKGHSVDPLLEIEGNRVTNYREVLIVDRQRGISSTDCRYSKELKEGE